MKIIILMSFAIMMIMASINDFHAFGSPDFPQQVIESGTSPNVQEGKYQWEEHLFIKKVYYEGHNDFLNVVFQVYEPFDESASEQIRYGLLINSDTLLETGIGGYDYLYQIKWTGENWIEEYQKLPSYQNEGVIIEENVIDDPFDERYNNVEMNINLNKLDSPDFYNIIFFTEGTDNIDSFFLQDFTSLAVIPPHKFSISTVPNTMKFSPSTQDIFFIKIYSEIKGDPEIFFDVTQEQNPDFNIEILSENSFFLKNNQAEIPIKISVSDDAELDYHELKLSLRPWHNYYKESDIDEIKEDIIKNSFYRNQVKDEEFKLGFAVGLAESFPMSVSVQIALVIVTAILAGATYYNMRKTTRNTETQLGLAVDANKHTEEQLKLTQTEIEAKMRPLLQFDETQSFLKTASDRNFVSFKSLLKNSGTVDARKIRIHVKESNNEKISDLIKEKDEIFKNSREIGTIRSGENQKFIHDIPWKEGKKSTKIICWFDYSYLGKIEEMVAVIFVSPGREDLSQIWYVQEDIDEAVDEWKKLKSG